MVQADPLGPKVGGHLTPYCIHRVNHGELSVGDSTINIVLILLLFIYYYHVTPKGRTCDHTTLRAQYLESSWRCYLTTNAN